MKQLCHVILMFRHWIAQSKSCFKPFVPIKINSGNEITRGHCQLVCSDVFVWHNDQRGQLKLTLAFRPTHVLCTRCSYVYSHLHQNLHLLCCTPFSPSREVQKKSKKPISLINMYMYKIIWNTKPLCIFHSDFGYLTLQADSEGPRSERANSTSRGGKAMGGGMDMMAEMQRKLAARWASIQLRLLTQFDYLD